MKTILALCLLALAGCSVFDEVEPPLRHSPWIKIHFSSALVRMKCPDEACAIGYLQSDGVTVDPQQPCNVYLPSVQWEKHIEHEVMHCFLGDYDRHLHGLDQAMDINWHNIHKKPLSVANPRKARSIRLGN